MPRLAGAALIALTLAGASAWAAEPRGSAGLSVEADSEDGFAIAADLTLHATARTSWYALASYSDLSSSLAPVSTRGFETGLYHDFGRFGIDASLGTWRDPDLLHARHLRVAVDWHGEVWTLSAIGQLRQSDFEPFQASGTITLPDGRQVIVSARADCESGDVGLGLRLAFFHGAWDGYLGGMSYDYDATDCRFSSPGLESLARTRPEIFRQLAPIITARLGAYATTRIGFENALLKDSFSAGIGYRPARVGYGLDYSRQTELFRGLRSDTLAARASFDLTESLEATLTAGMTDSDTFDTITFGGVGIRRRF